MQLLYLASQAVKLTTIEVLKSLSKSLVFKFESLITQNLYGLEILPLIFLPKSALFRCLMVKSVVHSYICRMVSCIWISLTQHSFHAESCRYKMKISVSQWTFYFPAFQLQLSALIMLGLRITWNRVTSFLPVLQASVEIPLNICQNPQRIFQFSYTRSWMQLLNRSVGSGL